LVGAARAGASKTSHRSVAFVAGVDQETGVTQAPVELAFRNIDADVSHAEWLADSAHIVVISKEGPGRHVISTLAREGGDERVITRRSSGGCDDQAYRVTIDAALKAPCASTHSPLMRTSHVPVRALPFQPSGRKPMSPPEMIAAASRRVVCAATTAPVTTSETSHTNATMYRALAVMIPPAI
jgi:hypothetical protein